MRPAAVLFDMDGTLFDSETLWDIAINELAADYGAVVPEETRLAMVGRAVGECMTMFHEGIGQQWRDVAHSADWIYNRVEVLYRTSLVWRPGALELLSEVRNAGLPLALVTSTLRRTVTIAMGTLGHFDVVVCGDEVDGFTKPHPEPYLRAARMLRVDPATCVSIEDSPSGVASAAAAGTRVLGIPHHVPLAEGPRITLRPTLAGIGLNELAELSYS